MKLAARMFTVLVLGLGLVAQADLSSWDIFREMTYRDDLNAILAVPAGYQRETRLTPYVKGLVTWLEFVEKQSGLPSVSLRRAVAEHVATVRDLPVGSPGAGLETLLTAFAKYEREIYVANFSPLGGWDEYRKMVFSSELNEILAAAPGAVRDTLIRSHSQGFREWFLVIQRRSQPYAIPAIEALRADWDNYLEVLRIGDSERAERALNFLYSQFMQLELELSTTSCVPEIEKRGASLFSGGRLTALAVAK